MSAMRTAIGACVVLVCGAVAAPLCIGQEQTATDAQTISINLPDDVALNMLADYVSQRLKLNIIYDEELARQKITIKAPTQVPTESLLSLLQSVLHMKGYTLVEGKQKGWMKVVKAAELAAVARDADADGAQRDLDVAVTRIYELKHVEARQVEQLLKPFLSGRGANTVQVPDRGLLIVTDFSSNLSRLTRMIQMMDQPRPESVVRFVAVKHVAASAAAQEIGRLLQAKARSEGQKTAVNALEVSALDRTNEVVFMGQPADIDAAQVFLKQIDVPLALTTHTYRFVATSPERVDSLTKQLIGPLAVKAHYQSAIDREAGLLIVTATPAIHERVAALKGDLDVATPVEQSPIRFYKLANTKAADVLDTISSIEGGVELGRVSLEGVTPSPADPQPAAPGGNSPPPASGLSAPASASVEQTTTPLRTVKTDKATVTADPNTNTIIVVADQTVHRVYERLIKQLDRRRPQVLIECTAVTIDTSAGFSLGVEISKSGGVDGGDTLTFSSFGLSTVDAATGSLTLVPGLGFNGAVLSPDIADIVIKALKTNGRTRVVSSPRILVNDNATGTLASVAEAPFTTTTTQQTTDAVTFGGYASAGTTVTVTPHIAEGDHLQLEYSIDINSFTGDGGAGVPPPRQTDSISSEVTIPDGHTIIVGGLKRRDLTDKVDRIPILGEIPVLEYLFSSRSESQAESSLFLFIRPVVLRDDQFEDLKYLSQRDLAAAELPGDYPVSQPLFMN
jgi:general secretion pathway protein D